MNRRMLALMMATCLIPLCGCAGVQRWWNNGLIVGPDYRRPVVNAGNDWIEALAPAVVNDRQQYHDWWAALNDPMLDQLVQAAYQQNLTLRAAGLRVLEARTQRQIATANLLPQSQNFFGQFARNQLSRNTATASPLAPRAFDDWQTGFDLS